MRPHHTWIGPGCLAEIAAVLARVRPRKLMLVAGPSAYPRSGAQAVVEPAIAGHAVVRFTGTTANPTLADVKRGIALWRAEQPDAIVAVGGGSVLDLAKLVGLLGPNAHGWDGSASIGIAPDRSGVPLIAIPTTAGSGAEATCFATYYVAGEKRSLSHPLLRPGFVLVDPLLTASMPPQVAAASGLDALAQAIESLWAIGATPDSAVLAEAALRLILPCLGDLLRAPTPALRERLARDAHLAGQAINLSRTTAAHALSYTLTSDLNLAHGHAVALMLPAIFRINASPGQRRVADPRGAAYLAGVIGRILSILHCRDGEAAAQFLERQTAALGLATSFRCGTGAPLADDLARRVNAERLGNNPVVLSHRDIVAIYQRLFAASLAA